jgi:hypothetical protein
VLFYWSLVSQKYSTRSPVLLFWCPSYVENRIWQLSNDVTIWLPTSHLLTTVPFLYFCIFYSFTFSFTLHLYDLTLRLYIYKMNKAMWSIDQLLRGYCKQRPFLGNGSVNTFRGNEYPRNNRVNVGNRVFYMRSMPRCYNRDSWRRLRCTRVEAGSNTSTVTLRVVGGDEKGSLKSETVKYEKTMLARTSSINKRHTRLSSERAPHKNKTVTVEG